MKDGVNCHLLVGHLGSFKSVNLTVREDAKAWNAKIAGRPKNATEVE
jgi:5-methylcytosine-specific restriction enzyme A